MAFGDVLRNIAYSARSLCRDVRLTSAVLLTVALGVGLNSALFGVVDGLLLKPAPGVRESKALVALYRSSRTSSPGFSFSSYPTFLDWRDGNRTFAAMAAFREFSLDVVASGHVEKIDAMAVSANYFEVLRLQPLRGRFFVQEEDKVPGKSAAVVLSYRAWQCLDGDVLGKAITLNTRQFVVVGIAPKGFLGTNVADAVDAWVPITMAEELVPEYRGWLSDRNTSWLYAIGRLRHGVTISQAQADMDVIAQRLERSYPRLDIGNVVVYPRVNINPYIREAVIQVMILLTGLAGLVLLVVCTNTANLFLSRGIVRRREIGIRLALGAGPIHIICQLLTESLLLSLSGGLLGLLVGGLSIRILSNSPVFHESFPLVGFGIDYMVFMFAIVLSIVVGVLVTVFSLFQFSSPELASVLKDSTVSGGSYRRRIVNLAVISQISVSVVMLMTAGLLVETYRNYLSVNPLFHTADVFVTSFNLDLEQYSSTRGRTFYGELLKTVRGLPGVVSACVAMQMPLGPWLAQTNIAFVTDERNAEGAAISVDYNVVTPEYFRMLEIPVIRGRGFTDEDNVDSPPVVVVNETMANRYWPGEDPVEKIIRAPRLRAGDQNLQIIGVVRNSKYYDLAEQARPMMYFPMSQLYNSEMTLLIRTAPHLPPQAAAVLEAARSLDPMIPVKSLESLSRHVEGSFALQRATAILVSSFACLVATLAAVGLYSVLSYAVSQRTREIGVRLALGAQTIDVLKLMLRQGINLLLTGIFCGLVFGQIVARLLQNMLYGTGPMNPIVILMVSIVMIGLGLLATYIPARQATSVDPLTSLRQQ